jgi:hypothetical protein
MFQNKIQQLAHKFSQKISKFADFPVLNEQERKFYAGFQKEFRILLNEMEGDLMALKHKDLHKSVWRQFALLWKNLLDIYKNMSEYSPANSKSKYGAIEAFLSFVNGKTVKSTITNLDAIIQRYLQDSEVDFDGRPLPQVRVNSLKQLLALTRAAQSFVNAGNTPSPQQLSPRDMPTIPAPKPTQEQEQPAPPTQVLFTGAK